MTPDMYTLCERVERIERQNRRFRLLGGAALAAFGALVLMGQAPVKGRTLEAETIILKDADGKVRLRMETKGHAVLLRLFDRQEQVREELAVADKAAYITIGDATGRPRIMAGVQGEGNADETSLALSGKNGDPMAELTSTGDTSGLKIFDAHHRLASSFLVSPEGNNVTISDPAGTPRARLGLIGDKSALLLYDGNGKLTRPAQ
jgi:hypothetical protein